MRLLSTFLKRKLKNGRVKSDHVEYVKRTSTCTVCLKKLYPHPILFLYTFIYIVIVLFMGKKGKGKGGSEF